MLKFLKVLMGMLNKSAIIKKFWQLSYIVAPKLLIKKKNHFNVLMVVVVVYCIKYIILLY